MCKHRNGLMDGTRAERSLRHRFATLFTGVVVFTGTVAAQSIPLEPEPVNLGALKFPGDIYQPYLITVGLGDEVFRQGYSWSIGGTSIRRTKQERADADDTWVFMEGTQDAGFIIPALAARNGGDEIYVAGLRQNGSAVIERWTHGPRVHGWSVTFPLPSDVKALGQPAPPAVPVVNVAGGPPWAPVRDVDKVLSPPRRVEVYSSPDGPLHGMSADPQGRYLIFFDMGRGELIQLDLTQVPFQTNVLSTPASDPPLAAAGNIQVMDFEGEGRHLLVRPVLSDVQLEPETYHVFSDTENDGAFESVEVMDEAEWDSSIYSDWSKWNLFTD